MAPPSNSSSPTVECRNADTRRLTEDSHDEAIVRAIIQIVGSLQLKTIAEGIEGATTLARLVALGCQGGQGYLWSPAVPPAQFIELVRRHREKQAAEAAGNAASNM